MEGGSGGGDQFVRLGFTQYCGWGTEAVEGIILNFSTPEEVHFSNEAFAKMNKLRLLRVCNLHCSGGFEYFFQKGVHFSLEEFVEMNKVRVIKDCSMRHSEEFNYLSNELRCLKWHGYPAKSMPLSFHPKHLVELHMCCSRIEQLWKTKV
ncbi:hypothetical protein L1049_025422 [Liquidambar formosana]|uniref:Uncharacterized protein n=1 Tax=Liquidambar formosana TaxID=63359 RepID=A0AAP0R6C5_LIQFO